MTPELDRLATVLAQAEYVIVDALVEHDAYALAEPPSPTLDAVGRLAAAAVEALRVALDAALDVLDA